MRVGLAVRASEFEPSFVHVDVLSVDASLDNAEHAIIPLLADLTTRDAQLYHADTEDFNFTLTPKERELLQGMGNCYSTCHANFDETVQMVSSARGLHPDVVKTMLRVMRERDGQNEEYKVLRKRLPDDFPI